MIPSSLFLCGVALYFVASYHITAHIVRAARLINGTRLSRGHILSLYILSPISLALIVIGDALLGERE